MAINARKARAASEAVGEAGRVALNARRRLRQLGTAAPLRLESVAHDLEVTVERVARIVHQTRQRLAGSVPEGATRLVSLHDPDARPIRKGRLGKPVEFGYKAQVVDNEDGIVLDHAVFIGNPPDAPMLVPAIQRISQLVDDVPKAVTADRGYGEVAVGDTLSNLGVREVVLPTKGKPTAARRAVENKEAFQELVRWRTGSEGRISCLKRDFGWNRTRIDGLEGAKTWCGHGVFNHSLVNTPSGMIGENGAGIDLVARDTSFDNAGTLNMLFLGQLRPCRGQPSSRLSQGHHLPQHRHDISRGWR